MELVRDVVAVVETEVSSTGAVDETWSEEVADAKEERPEAGAVETEVGVVATVTIFVVETIDEGI